jgi:hypothetical protein
MYENIKLKISQGQKAKIKRAYNNGTSVTIRIDPKEGEDVLALTKTQINKIKKAKEKNKGVDITLSKAQLKHNLKVEGGFLGARVLPAIASKVLPALGIGALTGAVSTGVQKLLGNGLYLKKGGCLCKTQTNGKGLLTLKSVPYHPEFDTVGDGLHLITDQGLYDGKGLLLGENSPFKNIPILGVLL